jgi:hypothetical protein
MEAIKRFFENLWGKKPEPESKVTMPEFIQKQCPNTPEDTKDTIEDLNFIPKEGPLKINEPEMEKDEHKMEIDIPEMKKDEPKMEIDIPEMKKDEPKMEIDMPEMKKDEPKMEMDMPEMEKYEHKMEIDKYYEYN